MSSVAVCRLQFSICLQAGVATAMTTWSTKSHQTGAYLNNFIPGRRYPDTGVCIVTRSV